MTSFVNLAARPVSVLTPVVAIIEKSLALSQRQPVTEVPVDFRH